MALALDLGFLQGTPLDPWRLVLVAPSEQIRAGETALAMMNEAMYQGRWGLSREGERLEEAADRQAQRLQKEALRYKDSDPDLKWLASWVGRVGACIWAYQMALNEI